MERASRRRPVRGRGQLVLGLRVRVEGLLLRARPSAPPSPPRFSSETINRYYWRIRALDQAGNAGVWNLGPSFDKTFDNVTPDWPVGAPSINNLRMRDNLADPGTDVDVGTADTRRESRS
jgi:hypothetical protein